jgi:hypothetical protein
VTKGKLFYSSVNGSICRRHARSPIPDAAMDTDPSRQVCVRFFTNLPPPLRMPTTNLSRMWLSEIVNDLLAVGERPERLEPHLSCPSVG